MKFIDHTHSQEVVENFNYLREKLIPFLLDEGVDIDERGWPDLGKSLDATNSGKVTFGSRFFEGSNNLIDIVDRALNDLEPINTKSYQNLQSKLKSLLESKDIIYSPNWGKAYDIFSKTYLLFYVGLTVDSNLNHSNSTQQAMEHNLKYYKKIGPTSPYNYEYLEKATQGYTRTADIDWDDTICRAVAKVAKYLQNRAKGFHCKRMPLDKTTEIAESKNNKNFVGHPVYANVKIDDNRELLYSLAEELNGQFNEEEVDPVFQLHRIQNASNLIIEYSGIHIDASGTLVWNPQMIINAIQRISAERGSFSYYQLDKPEIIPDLQNIITYEELPKSFDTRKKLVDQGIHPKYILNTFPTTGDFKFNYKVTGPRLWQDGHDVEDDFIDPDAIMTKHRSIAAVPSYVSRIGQQYLYPLDDATRLLKDTRDYSCAVKLNHPDEFLRYFTDLVAVANPGYATEVGLKTSFDMDDLNKLYDHLESCNIDNVYLSMDDKDGFDMYQHTIITWLYCCTYFPFAFDNLEDFDFNNFKRLNRLLQTILLITPSGCISLSEIIGSGHPLTNNKGSYTSEIMGLTTATLIANGYRPKNLTTDNDISEKDEGEENVNYE